MLLLLAPMPSGMVVGVRALRCWGLISWLTDGSLFMLFILFRGGELLPYEDWDCIEVLGRQTWNDGEHGTLKSGDCWFSTGLCLKHGLQSNVWKHSSRINGKKLILFPSDNVSWIGRNWLRGYHQIIFFLNVQSARFSISFEREKIIASFFPFNCFLHSLLLFSPSTQISLKSS